MGGDEVDRFPSSRGMPFSGSYLRPDSVHGAQSLTRSGSMSITPLLGNPGIGMALAPVLEVLAGLRVERVEEEGRRRVEDHGPSVDLAVGHAFPVVVAHAAVEPRGVGLAVGPQRLARGRVDGRDRTALAGDGVERPIDVERSGAEDVVHGGPEVVAPPHPCDLELLEVAGVDLIERQIPHVRRVAADVAPLALRRAALLRDGRRQVAAAARRAHRHADPRLPPTRVF